jgi:hypothetical protein
MTNVEFKIGDRIEVVIQNHYMDPEVGARGIIVSMNNEYPKVKFDESQIYAEDLGGLVTVDPIGIITVNTEFKLN